MRAISMRIDESKRIIQDSGSIEGYRTGIFLGTLVRSGSSFMRLYELEEALQRL